MLSEFHVSFQWDLRGCVKDRRKLDRFSSGCECYTEARELKPEVES